MSQTKKGRQVMKEKTSREKTLTADLRRGDETQVLLKLQRDGIMPDDYAAIATNPDLRNDVVVAILEHCMFASAEQQIKSLLKINKHVWKDPAITEKTICKLGNPPNCPVSSDNGLYCVTLFYETGDPIKTFKRNWQACEFIYGKERVRTDKYLMFIKKVIRQRQGAESRPSGFRWNICELGRQFKGKYGGDVRSKLDQQKLMGIGQELPFIAAMHPRWAFAINHKKIPCVDAPDLEIFPDDDNGHFFIPYLEPDYIGNKLFMGDHFANGDHPRFGSGSLR